MTSTSEPIVKKNLGSIHSIKQSLRKLTITDNLFTFFFLIFIYLAALGLSCGTWDL